MILPHLNIKSIHSILLHQLPWTGVGTAALKRWQNDGQSKVFLPLELYSSNSLWWTAALSDNKPIQNMALNTWSNNCVLLPCRFPSKQQQTWPWSALFQLRKLLIIGFHAWAWINPCTVIWSNATNPSHIVYTRKSEHDFQAPPLYTYTGTHTHTHALPAEETNLIQNNKKTHRMSQ